MEEIDEFVRVYNEYLKAIEESYPDVEYIVKVCNDYSQSGIQYFLTCFRFPSKYNYPEFCFESDRRSLDPGMVHFATNYNVNLYYVSDVSNGRVSVIDFDTEDIVWHCASSVSAFFKCMSIVMEVKALVYRSKKYDLEKEYLMPKFNQCMALNDLDNKFRPFYIHILCIPDEWI